jgi:hypothetical protein
MEPKSVEAPAGVVVKGEKERLALVNIVRRP